MGEFLGFITLVFVGSCVLPPPGVELLAVAATAEAGRITRLHRCADEYPLIASSERTDATSYHHPGGGVAGVPIPAGWYSEPWWGESLRSGM